MYNNKIWMVVLPLCLLCLAAWGYAQTDITNNGGTITAQYTDSPSGEDIAKLIDNNTGTKYLTFHGSGWMRYQSPASQVVVKYTITSGNDAAERDPKNWTLDGSTNGSTWTTINTQTNQTFASRGLKKEYTFSNSTSYTYYRLNVTAVQSGTTMQIAEWELWTGSGTPPPTGVVTVYKDCPYGGASQGYAVGTYTTAQMVAKGTVNNDISSVKVTSGYKVTFYDSDNFTGTSVVVTADNSCLTANNFNDMASSMKVEVNSGGGWTGFVYPTVDYTNLAGSLEGVGIFNTAMPNVTQTMKDICLQVCQTIYSNNSDSRRSFSSLHLQLADNPTGVAWAWGDATNHYIGISAQYVANVYHNNSNSYSAVTQEMKGVLAHEATHGYQWEPKNCGSYDGSSQFWALIEGEGDGVRGVLYNWVPLRSPTKGGSWMGGYNTTGFFFQWAKESKKASFLIDLNHTCRDMSTWSFEAAFQSILGMSVQSAWNEYQTAKGAEMAVAVSTGTVTGLSKACPNPFSQSTAISYQMEEPGQVSVVMYNALGQRMKTLVHGTKGAGVHSVIWDARDENGNRVSAGVYYCRLEKGQRISTIKVVQTQ